MPEHSDDRPTRRVRYHGTHPRHFQQRYKELQPDRYAEEVDRLIAAGRTPAGTHRPIMVREVVEHLNLQPGQTVLDCTLGYGGHSTEVLKLILPGGRLLAVDADPVELPKTESRLRSLGIPHESLIARRMNYAGIASFVLANAPDGVDAIMADLGLSSMQIDDPSRGFSFKTDGPLDMRMNPGHGLSASALLSKLSERELGFILKENADEPLAGTLSKAIHQANTTKPLTTTRELAEVVRNAILERGVSSQDDVGSHTRRVFQALRIEVNDEFGSLKTLLQHLPSCLKPGGRVVILSFHSGEDRRVKKAFQTGLRDGVYSEISDEVIRPTIEEQRANPRSTSAKLRWAIKR